MTIEIAAVYEEEKREDVLFVIMWSYFYVNHVVCIMGSIFLHISVSKVIFVNSQFYRSFYTKEILQRDISRLKTYMKYSVTIYVIWMCVNVGQAAVLGPPHSLVTPLVAALALYKLLSFLIVYFFLKRWMEFSKSHCETFYNFYIHKMLKTF